MQSRMQKWEKYRQEIRNTPDEAFPKKKSPSRPIDDSDRAAFLTLEKASSSIGDAPLEERKPAKRRSIPPYVVYERRLRREWILKISAFVLVVLAMLLWYLLRLK